MSSLYDFDVESLKGVQAPTTLPISRTDNPYWDIVRTIRGNWIQWKYYRQWEPDWITSTLDGERIERDAFCGEYTWAIPDPDSLDFVAQWLAPAAIEIGAGTGYWAWQLSQLGVDMLAYDLYPPQHTGQNHYHSPRTPDKSGLIGQVRSVFFDVRAGNELVAKQFPERILFLCWPPYESSFAFDCLKAYQGKRLVFIGESSGGCTANDAFYGALNENWQEIAEHKPVQWSGIRDHISVYERIAPHRRG